MILKLQGTKSAYKKEEGTYSLGPYKTCSEILPNAISSHARSTP